MPDYKNPDNIGNHLELYGYHGWEDGEGLLDFAQDIDNEFLHIDEEEEDE